MDLLVRMIRPWAAARPEALDSLVMEARDRWINLGFFAAAAVVWLLVGLVLTTRDPVLDPGAGFIGAGLIGLAIGLTLVPIFWLVVFGRHRQIAYQGDWTRAVRRAAWVGVIVTALVGIPRPGRARLADRAVHDRARARRRDDPVHGALTGTSRRPSAAGTARALGWRDPPEPQPGVPACHRCPPHGRPSPMPR